MSSALSFSKEDRKPWVPAPTLAVRKCSECGAPATMPNASHFTKLEKTFVPALKTTASGRVKIVIMSTRSKKMPMAAFHICPMQMQARPQLGYMTKQSPG